MTMKHIRTAILITAVFASAITAYAKPKLAKRYSGTVAAGATATNTVGSQVQGQIGSIKLKYAATATNAVAVNIQHTGSTNAPWLVYATTMESAQNAVGGTAGIELVEAGDKLITDNSAGSTNVSYMIDIIKED
jgi:hypothetical protein